MKFILVMMMNTNKLNKIKWTAICGIAAAILVFSILPNELTQQAKIGIAILIWAVIWWIFKVLPDYVTAMLMAVLFVVFADVPSSTVFSAFSGSSWWLLFTAFGISLGVTKSGLMRRISLHVLRIFPGTFEGQTLGLLMVGAVTAPFIPSMSAKAAMLAPLAVGISDSMGYGRKSKHANGMFLAMLTGLRNPGPLFISASVLGYALLGHYPEGIRDQFTMWQWFINTLPWFVCVTLLNYVVLILLYRPKKNARIEKNVLDQQIHSLGPMTKKERYMLGLTGLTLLLWVTESLHGISPHIVAISALCLTLAGNVYDKETFKADLSWDSIIFIGVVLGLAPVFDHLGITHWIVEKCSPLLKILAVNPYLLITGAGVLTVLIRFILVSELAFVNVFMVFTVPAALEMGINPWVIGIAVYALVNPWFFLYQNPVYIAAYHGVRGEALDHGVNARYCLIYVLICIVGLLISVPYWLGRGIFYL